ncbi:hypothetical protein AB0M47_06405 [Hamadaea sp. NPDC051192]|uniref:hypothetical protein n=1 Tax=Hamadaea sp. NPDC051192 TaxID=3154940 RepID=UPI0034449631
MAMEMPPWCGRCDQQTRRFDLGDSERRCPECHPYWAFGHSSIDPARVPVGRAAQEQAVRWLLYELVSLRELQPPELRRRLSRFFEAGWTPLDVVHALDHDPDGSSARGVPLAGDLPARVEQRVLNLLAAWCDADGQPLASISQQAARRRDRMHERQRAAHAAWAEVAARPINPDAALVSGARGIAAEARRRAEHLRLEGRRRERAALAAQATAIRARQDRINDSAQRLAAYAVRTAAGVGEVDDLAATRHECAAELDDTAYELHVVSSGCDADVTPSVADFGSAGRRNASTSMRRSVGASAARRGGTQRRAA